MCGISAAKIESGSGSHALAGLKRLEYRGYDSAGIASQIDDKIVVEKELGEVENLQEPGESTAAVGHTRWATHGGVTEENAHPHTSCDESIAVVHNGIIENFEELRDRLQEKGHTFSSDTDTEVIPHLVEHYMDAGRDLWEAVEKTDEKLEGSYAVVVLHESGDMAAMRRDSPLVVGEADDGYYVSSDVTAFLDFTKKARYLEEGDIAMFQSQVQVYNSGESVERPVKEIDWDAEQASKQGYSHFMQKEIAEQSSTIRRAAFQNRTDLEEAAELVEEAGTVYITGCGTASYAGMMAAEYLREAGVISVFEQSHELEYRTDEIGEDDLVIAVSQSGETADLLSMLKDSPAKTLAIVNVVGSTLARNADKSLFVNAGPEIGVASTKAFTAQLTVAKLLSGFLKDDYEQVRESLVETAGKVEETLELNRDTVENLSSDLAEKQDVYYIGRGKGRVLSLEAALKLKELSYIHAEGFPGGEFKHGTLALVEEGVPVVVFSDHHSKEIESNAIEARSRGAEIIGCGSEPRDYMDRFIQVPADENNEILEIVPFQMLAYLTSVKLEHNPDKPRNLAKSVTVK